MPRPRKPKHRRGYKPGSRAGDGQGAILQIPSGRWRGAFTWHHPETGESRRVWVTGDDEDDVIRRWRERRAELEQPQAAPEPILTVRDYLAHWLDTAVRTGNRQTTYEVYARFARRICEHIGGVRLEQLRAEHVRRFYAAITGSGQWSAKTVGVAHAILVRSCSQAVAWGYLERSPMQGVHPPRVERTERPTLGPDELVRLMNAAESLSPRMAPLWLLIATTGLRRGEAVGLRWDDLELDAGRLTVRGQLVQTSTGVHQTAPKTPSSLRTVMLMSVLVARLRLHQAQQANAMASAQKPWPASGYVFRRADGRPMSPGMVDEAWRRFLVRAGASHLRIHDLRHGVATLLVKRGEHIKVVSEMLGHSNVKITLDLYAHVSPVMHTEAVGRLAGVLWPSGGPIVAASVAADPDPGTLGTAC